MTDPVRIFVSHSHEDNAWCRDFVMLLRDLGADVWYDEHNLGSGMLMDVIERELRDRPHFVVVLSTFSIKSRWVRLEIDAAMRLQDKAPDRVFLPVVSRTCEIPLLLGGYKYISGPQDSGVSPSEAAGRVAHTLGVAISSSGGDSGEPPDTKAIFLPSNLALDSGNLASGIIPGTTIDDRAQGRLEVNKTARTSSSLQTQNTSTETAADVLSGGKNLVALGHYDEAIQAFEHATAMAPDMVDAWLELGNTLLRMGQDQYSLSIYDQVLALDPNNPLAWSGKAIALKRIGRYEEAGNAAKAAQIAVALKHRFMRET